MYPPFDSANLDVVRADEMLTTFLELEAAIRVAWREMKILGSQFFLFVKAAWVGPTEPVPTKQAS